MFSVILWSVSVCAFWLIHPVRRDFHYPSSLLTPPKQETLQCPMTGLLVEEGSLPSPPCLSGHCSWNQLISASLNAYCPRLMNHEAGCRTEIPVFMFRPPGRKGPAEPQIRASCSNPDSPEVCGGGGSGGQHSQWSLVVTYFLWLLWLAPPLSCTQEWVEKLHFFSLLLKYSWFTTSY